MEARKSFSCMGTAEKLRIWRRTPDRMTSAITHSQASSNTKHPNNLNSNNQTCPQLKVVHSLPLLRTMAPSRV